MKLAVVTVAIIVVGAAILFFWSRLKRQEIKSFWDIVRNPDAMQSLDEFDSDVDEAATSLSGSPKKIAKLVDFFVFDAKTSQDAWTELQILAQLEYEAYPRALEILQDPSMKERLTVLKRTENSLPEGPINRLCQIFDQDAPPPEEAVPLLAPYLQSESAEIRKSVALTIGSIASADSLPVLGRALKDKDEYVRSYALMGIERAIKGNRINALSKGDLFALVADMWPGDTRFSVCDKIPLVLLKLDRERAMDYLLSDELFSVSFSPAYRILEAFKKESVAVPRPRLLSLIADASNEPIKYPLDYVLAEALPLLGTHRNEEDLATLERYLDHSNEKIARGATEALYYFHQYYELIRDPWGVVEKSGWNALTAAEKHILAIEQLDAEVNNGGFAQYYFNSSGDNWQTAYEGLAAIGAEKRGQLMLATIEAFGNVKPAAGRSTRNSQLSKIVRKKEDPFNEQDDAWYAIADENLDRLMLKYNLANLEGRRKAEQSLEGEPQ